MGTFNHSKYPTNIEIRKLIEKRLEYDKEIKRCMLIIQEKCNHEWTEYSQNYNIFSRECLTCGMRDSIEY